MIRFFRTTLTLAVLLTTCSLARAHFPWLVRLEDGKVAYFFGESLGDRTYKMPASIGKAKIAIIRDGQTNAGTLKLAAIDADEFIGLRTDEKVGAGGAVFAKVTYGLFRGSRLDYYSISLDQELPKKRDKSQVVPLDLRAEVTRTKSGLKVFVIWKDKPLSGINVQLFDAAGDEQGVEETDEEGVATFKGDDVSDGINGLVLGHTVKGESGEFDDKAYESAAHSLTVTFRTGTSKKKVDTKERAATEPAFVPVLQQVKLHRPLEEPLTSFGAAVQGDYLYVFSGHDGAAHGFGRDALADHFRRIKFDDPEAKWEELAKHEPAQSTALISDGKYLYRIGGLTFLNSGEEETNFKSTTHFSRFDPETNKWTELATLPEPRSSLDAALVGRSIFVVGGWDLQGESSSDAKWHETIHRFDLDAPQAGWQTLPGPGYLTRAASAAAHVGKLYVFGGIQQRGFTRKVSVFDPLKNSWTEGPELPSDSRMAGFATSSFATGGNLFVTGASGVVYQLNDEQSDWNVAGRLIFPRMFLRLLPAADDRLLALGGTSSLAGRLSVVESFPVTTGADNWRKLEWSVDFGGRAKHSQFLVRRGGKLYAFGGNASRAPHDFSKEAFVKEAYVFDIPNQSVEKLPDLPRAMQSGAAMVYSQTSEHKKIVLAGGLGMTDKGFSALDGVLAFDPEGKTWDTSSVTLPSPRSMFHGVFYEDALWMFGGADAGHGGGDLGKAVLHWWGDETGVTELPNSEIPTPRRSFGGVLVDSEYYAVGGLAAGIGLAETVDVFNLDERTWKQVAAPQTPRVFPSLAAVGKKLYLHGGFTSSGGHFTPAKSLEVYDIEKNTWTTLATEVPGISPSMRMMTVGERLLFFGVDSEVDGRANFVLLDPAPLANAETVEGFSFTSRRSAGEEVTQQAKSLMRRDQNKDGKLTREELGKRLASLLEQGDTDSDGALTYREAKAALSKQTETN